MIIGFGTGNGPHHGESQSTPRAEVNFHSSFKHESDPLSGFF